MFSEGLVVVPGVGSSQGTGQPTTNDSATVASEFGDRAVLGALSLGADDYAVITSASIVRLKDPERERERIILIERALTAGRKASQAMQAWLSRSLSEYRGSRSSWNLLSTSVELRKALEEYEMTLRETVARLRLLVPEDGNVEADAEPLARKLGIRGGPAHESQGSRPSTE